MEFTAIKDSFLKAAQNVIEPCPVEHHALNWEVFY